MHLGPAGAERLGSWTLTRSQQHGGAGCRRGRGAGAASGALSPGAPAPAPGQALAPAPVPAAASQFTLRVMRPCGGQDEAAAEVRPAAGSRPGGSSAGAGKPTRYLCEVAGDGEEEAGEDETDLLDTSDPGGRREYG